MIKSSHGAPMPVTGFLDGSRIGKVAAILASGGIAVLPTDTLYGFHCAASNLTAAGTIRRLKGRRSGAGFILLASDLGMVDAVVSRWPGSSRTILLGTWPGPLTALLPASGRVPRLLAPHGTVAVRIPAHGELRRLIRSLGEPLVSTSVNVAGGSPMRRIAEIRSRFPGFPAYLSRRGGPGVVPSTVVDFTTVPPRLARPGKYPWPGGE